MKKLSVLAVAAATSLGALMPLPAHAERGEKTLGLMGDLQRITTVDSPMFIFSIRLPIISVSLLI